MNVILSLPGERERERDSELDSDWDLSRDEQWKERRLPKVKSHDKSNLHDYSVIKTGASQTEINTTDQGAEE